MMGWQFSVASFMLLCIVCISASPPQQGQDDKKDCCKPVNGKWTMWTKYSPCSVSCGTGTRTRKRYCGNPAPQFGGSACSGEKVQTTACDTKKKCPQDGQWSGWKIGVCSKTCGGGVRTDQRKCDWPAPLYCGKKCPGLDARTVKCNEQECPRIGNKTCEGCEKIGNKCEQICTWKCIYIKNDRNYCENLGPLITKEPCKTQDGGWSDYKFGPCSKTCGGGIRIGKRKCNNPKPLNCGKPCQGKDTVKENCGNCPCPVWGPSLKCTKCQQLKGGKCQKTCTRNCIFERKDKQYCGKDSSIKEDCKSVNGGWTKFEYKTKCPSKCGGRRLKVRYCTNPRPEGCGKPCSGKAEVYENCKKCSDWGDYKCSACYKFEGKCNQTCARICHNKKGCKGKSVEYRPCKCPGKGSIKG